MIFVTVGTHEQQFNRLLQKVDELKCKGIINEEVMIQTGFSTYEPKFCEWKKLISYSDMIKYVNEARIVITHGGPSSFILPLQVGKIPIVVPRQAKFEEHVNDHQVDFVREVYKRMKNIIAVFSVDELGFIVEKYNQLCENVSGGLCSNNNIFNVEMDKIVQKMFAEGK